MKKELVKDILFWVLIIVISVGVLIGFCVFYNYVNTEKQLYEEEQNELRIEEFMYNNREKNINEKEYEQEREQQNLQITVQDNTEN